MALSITYRGFRGSTTDGTSHTFSACDLGTASDGRAILVAVAQNLSASSGVASECVVKINGVYAKLIGVGHYGTYGVGVAAYIARVPTGTSGDIVVTSNRALATCSIVWYSFNPSSLIPVDVASTAAFLSSTPKATDVSVTNGGALFTFVAFDGAYSSTPSASYNGIDTPTLDLMGSGGVSEALTLNAWHVDTTETVTTNDAGISGSGTYPVAVLSLSFGVAEPPIVNDVYTGLAYLGVATDATSQTTYTFSARDLGVVDTNRAILVGVAKSRTDGAADPTITVTIGGVSATQVANTWTTTYGSGQSVFIARVPTGSTGDIVVTSSASLLNCSVVWYSFSPSSLTAVDAVSASGVANSTTPTKIDNLEVVDGGVAFVFHRGSSFAAQPTWYYNGIDTPTFTHSNIDLTNGNSSYRNLTGGYVQTSESVATNDIGFNSAVYAYQIVGVSFGVEKTAISVSVTDTITTSETTARSAIRGATLSDSVGVKYRYPFETTVTDFLSAHDVSGPEVLGDGQDTATITDAITPAFPVTVTEGVRLSDTAAVAPLFNPVLVEPISVRESSNLGSPATLTAAFVAADVASLSTVSEVVISGPPFQLVERAAPTVTYRTAVASTARLAEDFDYAYGVTTVETPTISPTALGAVRPLPVVLEQIRWAETSATKLTYTPVLSRGIAVADTLRPGIPRTLTDTVAIAGALLSQHAIRVAERLNLLDPLVARMAYAQTIAQTISVYDTFNNFFGGAVSDSMVTADSLASNYKLRLPMVESAAISDSLQKHFVVRIISADQVAINHTQALKLLFRPTLIEGIEISAAYIAPNENFLTWVVNPGTGAVTEYTNFAFNSFAAFGNTYLAAKSDGLYALHGANDAGTSIVAQIRTALLQMNGGRLSALNGVYLGVRGNGTYQLKIIDGTGATSVYQFVVQNMETTKIRVGKGLRARYFAFELQNINGDDFDLDTIEIVPILAGRRV